ncbi:MAG: PQQ-binding-like beta-propeller repeat protein, partial [Candidatus Hydrogenedentes bacterium]|nr:PQQ-binding-like beta-propeller repeat protein [Candidatus Hydrogenedentota bacterium]
MRLRVRRREAPAGIHCRLIGSVLALAIAAGASAAGTVPGPRDWPTYRGDCRRSGVTTERLAFPLHEAWVHLPMHPPTPAWPAPATQDVTNRYGDLSPSCVYDRAFQVAVAAGLLFYGSSSDDTVYCLDAATGRMRWAFTTGGPVRLAPTVAGGRVYAGSDDGCVYCLDAKNGRLNWQYRAGPRGDSGEPRVRLLPGNGRMMSLWPVRSGVAVDDGIAYFSAGLFPYEGVYLCALDAKTGREQWTERINCSPQGHLLVSPARLFLPTGRTAPSIFSRDHGQPLGGVEGLGGRFALVLDDMLVHGPGERGQLHLADPDTRERIVSVPAFGLLAHGPTTYIASQRGLSALDRAHYLDLSRQIESIGRIKTEERTPEQKARLAALAEERDNCWTWTVPCSVPYEFILAGDTLLIGGVGEVAAYRATDGSRVWAGGVPGTAYGLAVSGGRLYVSTDTGAIHCFAPGSAPQSGLVLADAAAPASPYPEDEHGG